MRTKPSTGTENVNRELALIYRRMRSDDARAMGQFHSGRHHKGSPANCAACRAELRRQREERAERVSRADIEERVDGSAAA
jgi:hypothetical protein